MHVNIIAKSVNRVWQSEISRRREHEVQKMKKDLELLSVQHETSEASLRKRHQEAINELTDQLEQSNKHRTKSVAVVVNQDRSVVLLYLLLTIILNKRPK